MMFLIGLGMMGGYFTLIEFVIPYTQAHHPALSPFAFVLVSALYATTAMKLQTRLERYYIKRHVRKNPNSTWRYAGNTAS